MGLKRADQADQRVPAKPAKPGAGGAALPGGSWEARREATGFFRGDWHPAGAPAGVYIVVREYGGVWDAALVANGWHLELSGSQQPSAGEALAALGEAVGALRAVLDLEGLRQLRRKGTLAQWVEASAAVTLVDRNEYDRRGRKRPKDQVYGSKQPRASSKR